MHIPAVIPRGALTLPSEDMGVRILFEHDEFLIVYKPAGLVYMLLMHRALRSP